MAQVTQKLNATKFGYTDYNNPNTHYSVSSDWMGLKRANMLFTMESFPSNLGRKKLVSGSIVIPLKRADGLTEQLFAARIRTASFNAGTITYNTMPDAFSYTMEPGVFSTNPADVSISLTASRVKDFLTACTLSVTNGNQNQAAGYSRKTLVAGTAPYINVVYDSAIVESQPVFTTRPSSSTPVNPAQVIAFLWILQKKNSSEYCVNESFVQASAKLFWRVSGASTWNQISLSGTTGVSSAYNLPANTFPTGKTIQYYVQSTDTAGSVNSTDTFTLTTISTQITADSYPTGSKVDTRSAIPISWHFASTAGNYGQSSARFYWRVQGASSWNNIAASGTTQSLSVPANTFPTGATIEWYLSGTDAGGYTSTTATKTFTTVSSAIKLSSYPSGSSVYTGAALTFKWYYESSVGNYPQNSATFYWKRDSESSYRSISISGNTQQLSVAANTFPTGATVQWYISGTDIGGTASQTGVQSFKTLSSKITPQDSPTSGYSDPRYDITFRWYFSTTGGSVPQSSATFFWKLSTDENYTSVSASGSTQQVTIPANTFPVASTIQWYISGTDVGGTSSTSSVYSFSTAAGTAYAYTQSPIGTAVDGSKPVTLTWTLYNPDGSSPALVTLSWKQPTDSTWTVIESSSTPFSSWTVEANYFPVGEIEWRVVATNRDSIDGPASTAAFICLRAPDAPSGLKTTAVPRTLITWQSTGQEAYEVSIDGIVVQKAYGPGVNSYQQIEPLEDGVHTITVRIQGAYGFWSEPAETTVEIQNAVPSGWENVTISGAFDVDAVLTVSGLPDVSPIVLHWYRDGIRIGKTINQNVYTDRFVLGAHSYRAEVWFDSGNYFRTDTITGTMKSCVTRIAAFDGGEWIDLRLSANSDSLQSFTYRRTSSLRHVMGTELPVQELADFVDGSGSYDCAFRTPAEAAEFEALRGKRVIVKSRGGNVVIGALTDYSKRFTDFYITYTFTVQRAAWEDFCDVS